MIKRQIVLDIETTGINKLGIHYTGHNIIEIGAIEIINRNLTGYYFHTYIKPTRYIDYEAFKIHGINNNFLKNKPKFNEIADNFLKFINNDELIIHNAVFDIGFIDYEFSKLNKNIPPITTFCKIIDTLILAKKLFPGKRNNLNALCDRYCINKSKRTLHGALVDAEILAKIYITMTGGQSSLIFPTNLESNKIINNKYYTKKIEHLKKKLIIIYANQEEIINHEKRLDLIEKKSGKISLWRYLNNKKN